MLEEVGVVAGVGDDLAIGDLVDLGDDLIHELAVVGDEQEGAGVVAQVFLEPEQRDEVEMVGGLVQEEEVRFHHQESGEMGAHHPAAAEFLGGSDELVFTVAKPRQDLLGLGIDLGIGEGVVFGVGLHVGGAVDGPGCLQFLEALFKTQDFAAATGGNVEHGFLPDGFTLLGQVTHHGPGIPFDGAFVGLFLGEDDGEEGGFAGAVGADEGDVVAIIHLEGRSFEKDSSAVGHLEVADREHAVSPGGVGRILRENRRMDQRALGRVGGKGGRDIAGGLAAGMAGLIGSGGGQCRVGSTILFDPAAHQEPFRDRGRRRRERPGTGFWRFRVGGVGQR